MRPRSPLAHALPRFGAYATPGTLDALRRFKSGLGATTETGVLVSRGVSLGAGAAATAALTAVGGAALGAAAGSVVPVVGTVIGAAIGFLTQKLFGTANYAQVYSDVSNNMQLFEAYEGVAGQYPGRVYGWPEIHYVFYGAMFFGMFPGNGTSVWGSCTQASISSNINACGTSAWLDDWIGAGAPNPGSGTNNIVNLVGTALSAGVRDPRQIAQQYLVPGAEAVSKGKNNSWISVAGSRNPQLYTQMLIDIADVIVSTKYPSTPVYYGGIPGGSSVAQPSASVGGAAPQLSASQSAIVAAQNAAIAANESGAFANAPAMSTPGTTVKAGTSGALVTAAGNFTFGPNPYNSWGYLVFVNGAATTGMGVLLTLNASGQVILTDSQNNTFSYNGNKGWNTISFTPAAAATSTTTSPGTTTTSSAPAVNPAAAPSNSPAGTTITPSSGGSLISSAGTWTFGGSNDGQGNYQILLNGSAAAAGNSNATQLQINSSGTVVATVSNGATYGWGSGGWTSLSAPVTSVAVSTPVTISGNGATIIPGGGSQLITAQGEWTFSNQNDGSGNYYLLLNGSLAGSETGVQLTIMNSIPTLLRNDGSTWSWGGASWTQLTSANTVPLTTSDTPASLLNPTAPVEDTASYDGGPYADGLGSSSYSGGYGGYDDTGATAATPAVPVATTTTMSTTEKVLLYGGGGLALLALVFGLTRHHGAR